MKILPVVSCNAWPGGTECPTLWSCFLKHISLNVAFGSCGFYISGSNKPSISGNLGPADKGAIPKLLSKKEQKKPRQKTKKALPRM